MSMASAISLSPLDQTVRSGDQSVLLGMPCLIKTGIEPFFFCRLAYMIAGVLQLSCRWVGDYGTAESAPVPVCGVLSTSAASSDMDEYRPRLHVLFCFLEDRNIILFPCFVEATWARIHYSIDLYMESIVIQPSWSLLEHGV